MMSTRSIVGTTTDNRTFHGVFCHWDGYPTGMLPELAAILTRDGEAGREALVGSNWESIDASMLSADTDLPYPTLDEYAEATPRDQQEYPIRRLYQSLDQYGDAASVRIAPGYGERGLGDDRYGGDIASHRGDGWIEWVYIIKPDLSVMVMEPSGADGHLAERGTFTREDLAAVVAGDTEALARIGRVECGEDFSRCSHYAWFHDDTVPTESRSLGMRHWLGEEPIPLDRAIAATVQGKRHELTGGGKSVGRQWYMFTREGHDLPVIRLDGRGHRMKALPGVDLVFPPTKADVAMKAGV